MGATLALRWEEFSREDQYAVLLPLEKRALHHECSRAARHLSFMLLRPIEAPTAGVPVPVDSTTYFYAALGVVRFSEVGQTYGAPDPLIIISRSLNGMCTITITAKGLRTLYTLRETTGRGA